jgi:hypothetical protein
MAILKRKIQATTIVETIVALLLVFISFGIGISVYLNIMRTDALVLKTKAATVLERIMKETKQEDRFIDENIEEGILTISKKISKYDAKIEGLYILSLEAVNPENRVIHSLKELVYYPENNPE